VNRAELIEEFRQRCGLSRKEADWLVRNFFQAIAEGLKEDGRVELRGFGVFRTSERKQAGFLNPKDGRYYGGMSLRTIKFYPSNAVEAE